MAIADDLQLDLSQTIEIRAAMGDAYRALIRRLSEENSTPDNRPMPMVLTQIAGGIELSLRHRVLGQVEDEHRRGVVPGWNYLLRQTKQLAEKGPA